MLSELFLLDALNVMFLRLLHVYTNNIKFINTVLDYYGNCLLLVMYIKLMIYITLYYYECVHAHMHVLTYI